MLLTDIFEIRIEAALWRLCAALRRFMWFMGFALFIVVYCRCAALRFLVVANLE
jgi:hypothetical protein